MTKEGESGWNIAIDSSGQTRAFTPPDRKANFFGENGLFLLGMK